MQGEDSPNSNCHFGIVYFLLLSCCSDCFSGLCGISIFTHAKMWRLPKSQCLLSVLQSDCGWERPGREQPQHLPAVLSQWPLLGLRPKLPYLHEQPRSSDCSSDFVFLNACFFCRTVNSPIYTFSVWVPFLITSFSWGKEKAEAF